MPQVEELVFQEPWMLEALCEDMNPDIFFDEDPDSERRAKALCALCPARMRCLDYAFREGLEWGIYGGLKDTERRTLLKRLGRAGVQELCREPESLLPST